MAKVVNGCKIGDKGNGKINQGGHFNLSSLGSGSILGIGVDVAKEKLDVCILYAELEIDQKKIKKSKYVQIKNEEVSIKQFFKELKDICFSGKIVLESTNIFHLRFYEIGCQLGLSLILCNPQKVKQFAKFLHGNRKTDKMDSLVLANLAESGLLEDGEESKLKRVKDVKGASKAKVAQEDKQAKSKTEPKAKPKLQSENQLLVNQLRSLTKTKQVLSSQRRHCEELVKLQVLQPQELDNLKHSQASLDKQIELVESKIQKNVEQHYDSDTLDKLSQIPGVSPRIVSLILALMSQAFNLNQWLNFTGACPVNELSGTSLNKSKGLSKKGNRMLRVILYQMGFGAGTNKHGFFRSMYESLREKGRHHIEATLIVGKKVLRIFYCRSNQRSSF